MHSALLLELRFHFLVAQVKSELDKNFSSFICAVVKLKSAAICTASGPNNTHTIRLKSKYKNADNNVGVWTAFQKLLFMLVSLIQLFSNLGRIYVWQVKSGKSA